MIKAPYQLPLLLITIALLAVGVVVLSGYGAWKYVTREDSSADIHGSEPAQGAAPTAESASQSPAESSVERSGPRKVVAVPAAQRKSLAQQPETPIPSPTRPSDTPPDPATAALELAQRPLLIPVRGIEPDELWDTYPDARSGGRVHQALDIMAPRGTPVLAADDGQVAQLLSSKLGGISLYLYDSSESYCFYYAHLDRYADGLEEGETIRRGDVLGYVGSTGNAPNHAPHLHFSIHIRNEEGRCWRSETVNPFPILRYAGVGAK